ncbi:MAG: patatin-like phospholipase family protein [Leptospiraceae bacterium]|nr:patatin-like phospholipase family protein [Leptospiraceae bacterium]
MRYDSSRVSYKKEVILFYGSKIFSVAILELSQYGCRIKTSQYNFKLGSVVDIKLNNTLFYTGIIINKKQDTYGISMLAISKNNFQKINQLISSSNSFKENFSFTPTNNNLYKKILVLGAGSGKIFSQLELLKIFEKHTGKSIFDSFDGFAGVSSGGILATLIAMKYSLEEIREFLIKHFNSWKGFHLNILNSLFSADSINQEIKRVFCGKQFNCLEKDLLILSRSFSSGVYMYSTNILDSDQLLENAISESFAVPIIFGINKDMADGAVGLFINPSEIILRYYRCMNTEMDKLQLVYLDAGFDPIHRYKMEKQDIFRQMQWVLEITFRDLIISSFERIDYHFPNINFLSYIFTFSKSYDLLKKEDAFDAEKEILLKENEIKELIKDFLRTS